jgi:hypothetical protein
VDSISAASVYLKCPTVIRYAANRPPNYRHAAHFSVFVRYGDRKLVPGNWIVVAVVFCNKGIGLF